MVGCDQRLVLLHCSTTVVPVALLAPPRTTRWITCLKDARHVRKCVCLHPRSSILRPLEGCQTCSQMCLSAIVCILHHPSSILHPPSVISLSWSKNPGTPIHNKNVLTTHANYMMNKMHSSTHQRGLKHINLLIPNKPQRYKFIKICWSENLPNRS